MAASRSGNSSLSLPKAAISVGQTKVKSLGHKNTIFHLPGSDEPLTSAKAVLGSLDTTALRSNSGKRLPTVNMIDAPRCFGFGHPLGGNSCMSDPTTYI